MPMDIGLLFPTEDRIETVPDVVSFEVNHGEETTVILDQTDGRSAEFTAIGLTVQSGTPTN